jgi:hypothetical protein
LAIFSPALAIADDDRPPLSIYGFARIDYIADDSTMSNVDRPFFVESEPGDSGDNSEVSLHPRLSQIGLSLDPWRLDGPLKGEGRLEVDFQGDDGSSGFVQLRHAYFAVKLGDWVEVLGGQTWDLMSPLFPSANNDTMMWNAGNTGDRRPQFRTVLSPWSRLRIGAAVAMSGSADGQDLDGDGRLDGMESGMPMVQMLAEYRQRFGSYGIMRLGVWGHAAREELADGTELDSSSVGGHFYLPVPAPIGLVLMGEVFTGKNLSDIRGGIGQGVNPMTGEEIQATGGWFELVNVFTERHMLALGGSFDVVDADDIEDGGRESNATTYAVLRYRPHPSLQMAGEFIHWRTRYKNAALGVANRFNVHATMFF